MSRAISEILARNLLWGGIWGPPILFYVALWLTFTEVRIIIHEENAWAPFWHKAPLIGYSAAGAVAGFAL